MIIKQIWIAVAIVNMTALSMRAEEPQTKDAHVAK
jgi:hypothetical protein